MCWGRAGLQSWRHIAPGFDFVVNIVVVIAVVIGFVRGCKYVVVIGVVRRHPLCYRSS